MAATLADLRWFEGTDGTLVVDAQHLWLMQGGDQQVERFALRLMIPQISHVAVEEDASARTYRVRPVVKGTAASLEAVDGSGARLTTVELEYEAYRRLADWSAERSIRISNPAREARMARVRNGRQATGDHDARRPHRSARAVIDCLDRLLGVATFDELIAGTSGGNRPLYPRAMAASEVAEAVENLAVTVQLRGHQVVVKRSSTKGLGGHAAVVKALEAIEAEGELVGREPLAAHLLELESCLGLERAHTLFDAIGLPEEVPAELELEDVIDGDSHPALTVPESVATVRTEPELVVDVADIPNDRGPAASATADVMRLAREWPTAVGTIVRVSLRSGGSRVSAVCDAATGRLTVTSGVLAGKRFLDPTRAAISVVSTVSPDSALPIDGWSTWMTGTSTLADFVKEIESE